MLASDWIYEDADFLVLFLCYINHFIANFIRSSHKYWFVFAQVLYSIEPVMTFSIWLFILEFMISLVIGLCSVHNQWTMCRYLKFLALRVYWTSVCWTVNFSLLQYLELFLVIFLHWIKCISDNICLIYIFLN